MNKTKRGAVTTALAVALMFGGCTPLHTKSISISVVKTAAMYKSAVSEHISSPHTIDLMILHTPHVTNAQMDFPVSVANKAYVNSGVNIRLRVVAKIPLDYPANIGNMITAIKLRLGEGVFTDVKALREKYGADLVTFIRLYDETPKTGCGAAFVNGQNGEPLDPEDGFSVVNYKQKEVRGEGKFCLDTTLAHELGHNMGSAHDRQSAPKQGAFPYSYGYCIEKVVGDIMSHCDEATVPFFSSPDIIVDGIPLGVKIGEPNAADSVRSLNAVAREVANFMPTAK